MSWTFVVLALVLFLFAIYIGFLCGQWACEKRVITKRDYWIANFAGAAAVVLLTWVFSLFPLVQFAPIGWLGGFSCASSSSVSCSSLFSAIVTSSYYFLACLPAPLLSSVTEMSCRSAAPLRRARRRSSASPASAAAR